MENKYAKYKTNFITPPREVNDQALSELLAFDWFNFVSTAPQTAFVPDHVSVLNVSQETIRERKLRMLRQLSSTCMACSMCELGLKGAERNGVVRDPHVLSNMNPERIIVIGQGPGWDELEKREPFIGAAGKNFDNELAENGLDRSQFYINNAIRCYIKDNGKPTELHIARCRPFLEIEINLIKPIFIVTLGAVAFQVLCPTTAYSDGLGRFTNSIFGIKVFAIYHPSPLNMADQHRKLAFKSQIKALCTLIKTPNIRAKLGGGDEGKI